MKNKICDYNIMKKDRKVLEEWFKIAHRKALKKGLRRCINGNIYIDRLMEKDYYILTVDTVDNNKKEVINNMYKDLMLAETLCLWMTKKNISENSLMLMVKCIRW